MHQHFHLMTPRHRRAYTLVELVVVMMVIGILSAVAAPRYFDTLAVSRVDAAAKRIAADLGLMRARAMMKGQVATEEVRFYPAADRYELIDTPDRNHSGQVYTVELANTAYPADIVSVEFTNDEGATSFMTVQFDMYGRPWCGNAPMAPMVTAQILVQSADQQRTVIIDPVTGAASVQ
jgi:prepilin-type N-terminal cleavage/methylation domain-containing protein